jgi:hypothetical protein
MARSSDRKDDTAHPPFPERSTMTISTTNPEALRQRRDALDRANRVRRRRRHLRDTIARATPATGASLAAGVLLAPPGYAQTMTVTRLLTAIHGFGKSRAKGTAGRHAHNNQLGALSGPERARIAAETQRVAAHLTRRVEAPQRRNRAQAMDAINDANQVRFRRSRALREVASAPSRGSGAFRAAAILTSAQRPAELDGLAVQAVIEAIPRVQEASARRLLGPLKVSDTTTLAMLSRARAVTVASVLIARYGRGYELPAPAAPALEEGGGERLAA